MMAIDIIKDLRHLFGPARDQGTRPTCVAFATSDVHAAARVMREPLSVEHLYYHAVQRTPGGHPDVGVNLRTILHALLHDGQAAEGGWPYMDKLPPDLAAWKPPVTATPVHRCASTIAKSPTTAICTHLDMGLPVLLALTITEAFYSPNADGIVTPTANDPKAASHAVVAVAYGTQAKQQHILVRNSWGESWGLAGHAWLPSTYLDALLLGISTMQ